MGLGGSTPQKWGLKPTASRNRIKKSSWDIAFLIVGSMAQPQIHTSLSLSLSLSFTSLSHNTLIQTCLPREQTVPASTHLRPDRISCFRVFLLDWIIKFNFSSSERFELLSWRPSHACPTLSLSFFSYTLTLLLYPWFPARQRVFTRIRENKFLYFLTL